MSAWKAAILTLYPEMFPGPLGLSLAGRALADGRWALSVTDIRDFATDKHRSVDDTPAGGGAGMVMRADIAARAIDAARATMPAAAPTIYLSPRGEPLTQARAREIAAGPGAILLCGRFEGVDERVLEARGIEEVSIGDYVLSGGELAAMVLHRCLRAPPARGGRQRGLARRRELCGGPSRISAIYPPPRLRRPGHPRNSALGRSREDRQMAARAGREADAGTPPGFVGEAEEALERPHGEERPKAASRTMRPILRDGRPRRPPQDEDELLPPPARGRAGVGVKHQAANPTRRAQRATLPFSRGGNLERVSSLPLQGGGPGWGSGHQAANPTRRA